jgi:uncharacterized membrane protein
MAREGDLSKPRGTPGGPAYDPDEFGALAERLARFFGTPRYIVGQTIIVIIWIALNVAFITLRFDKYPFILLNLAFSTQAAYTGPVLLLAGNRQAQKDRLTLEHAASEADKADVQNVEILKAIETNTEVAVKILRHVESLVSDHIAAEAKA